MLLSIFSWNVDRVGARERELKKHIRTHTTDTLILTDLKKVSSEGLLGV